MDQGTKLIRSVLGRNLLFVHGKGGVGKTVVSKAIARSLSQKGERTLWVTFEDPTFPPGELTQQGAALWHLNCDFTRAFEEYATMKIGEEFGAVKIGVTHLTKIFLQNKLTRYLAKAAPGIHELVLLGKIWFERNHYTHVVVDMPSTGYGLAMFQSTDNFVKLFRGGPLNRDAEEMLATFRDSEITGHLIVALPEEMPLKESLELNAFLMQMFPQNPPVFIVNRMFPDPGQGAKGELQSPDLWPSPVPSSTEDYVKKRFWLENFNLRLWRDEGISYGELKFIPPLSGGGNEGGAGLVNTLSELLKTKAYL